LRLRVCFIAQKPYDLHEEEPPQEAYLQGGSSRFSECRRGKGLFMAQEHNNVGVRTSRESSYAQQRDARQSSGRQRNAQELCCREQKERTMHACDKRVDLNRRKRKETLPWIGKPVPVDLKEKVLEKNQHSREL